MRLYLSIPLPLRIGLLCTIGFTLLLVASIARADAMARRGQDWVRLTLKPCEDEHVVAVMRAQGQDPLAYRAGSAHMSGVDYAMCWQPAPGGAALVYDDGDVGFVPKDIIKPAPEA